jgi:serpin B
MLRQILPLLIFVVGSLPVEGAMTDVVRGNNQFAVDLFGKARVRPGNLFFSPYSISTALAMTYAGARGQTAREMASTLHFPAEGDALHASFAALDRSIEGESGTKAFQLDTANALWGQRGLSYLPEFLKITEANYRAGLHPVDFMGNPEAARKTINAWVEERTRDKIKDLLGPLDIRPDTDLVLTNAIYFKGAWAVPFPRAATHDEVFGNGDKSYPIPTMHLTSRFGYLDGEGDGFQALDLPYAGNALSMVVLLPKKVDGLAALEASLTAPKLAGWLGRLSPQKVEVSLPRFKLEYGLELSEALKSLGMPSAFEPKADFSGMTADRRLFISKVIHKAFADVNEEGTEAAASTAVIMTRGLAVVPNRPPIVFRADHPFLFLIRDVRSGSILFLGRVINPKA